MSKAPSPLLGFNNNIKHKGRVFHVQTEDSGVRHPHIITHLFMDGGRIVKTVKTSYAEHVGAENMGEVVRKMMKDQHKAMFVALRDGHFDDVIAKGSSGTSAAVRVPEAAPSSSQADAPPVSQAPVSRAEPAVSDRAAEPPSREPAAVAAAPAPAATPLPPGSSTSRTGRFPTAEALADELGTFERAAAEARRPQAAQPAMSDLPPPPANVLQKSRPEGGGYREVSPEAEARRGRGSQQPGASPSDVPPRPESSPPPPGKPAAGRYSVSRPAPAFASSKPPEGRSIFGEDLISEKSLDEVILSYLAEDLDTPPPKK